MTYWHVPTYTRMTYVTFFSVCLSVSRLSLSLTHTLSLFLLLFHYISWRGSSDVDIAFTIIYLNTYLYNSDVFAVVTFQNGLTDCTRCLYNKRLRDAYIILYIVIRYYVMFTVIDVFRGKIMSAIAISIWQLLTTTTTTTTIIIWYILCQSIAVPDN